VDNNSEPIAELKLEAPAKINLVLRVTGRRGDGYHELETWMQKLGLFDYISLRVTRTPGIELSCSKSDIPADSSNIVWQAAATFFKESRCAKGKGVSISLEKNIPVGAGLGGGSSDAGTLLKGLNHYFGNEFDTPALIDMAVGLGADVPFFVTGIESVFATGIGEKLVEVTPLSNCTFILVNPGVSVSTAEIFKKFALTRTNKNSTLTGSRKLNPDNLTLSDLQNDLEDVTISMFPVIAEIKNELRRSGADGVLMSGSGSTVFGVFMHTNVKKEGFVENAALRLRQKFGDKIYTI